MIEVKYETNCDGNVGNSNNGRIAYYNGEKGYQAKMKP